MMEILWEECNGRVEEDRIKYVEKTIGIKLPKKYLQAIMECDGGIPLESDFDFIECRLNKKRGECIGRFLPFNSCEYGDILTDFHNPPEFFPDGLVAFAETGGGDYICFDYRSGKDNPEPPIVYWSHDADVGKDVSFIAHEFEEFISILKRPEDLV